MFEFLITVQLIVGILIFVISILHYKSFLNPLGIFSIIWGTLPYIYSLQLMNILRPLSDVTYIALLGSFFSFVCGALIATQRNYVRLDEVTFEFTQVENRKIYNIYWIMLIIAIGEMFIKRPALLSDNPLATYIEGVGVRFLHFSVVILPVISPLIFLNKNIKNWKRVLILIPPLIIPLLWGQRGIAISYILSIMFVLTITLRYSKQLVYFGLGLFLLLQMIIFVGDIRTNISSGGKSINELAGIDESVPSGAVWAISYTTPAILNLEQTVTNPNTPCYYGFELIEPVLSLAQAKMFSEEVKKDVESPYTAYDGFNVPTYLYWCYLNFGYYGFFIVPFALGLLLQLLYNRTNSASRASLALFLLFMPSLTYSFHDFLFWNPGVVLNILIIMYIFVKTKKTDDQVNIR